MDNTVGRQGKNVSNGCLLRTNNASSHLSWAPSNGMCDTRLPRDAINFVVSTHPKAPSSSIRITPKWLSCDSTWHNSSTMHIAFKEHRNTITS